MTCAVCQRTDCAHPDMIYAGIVPAKPHSISAEPLRVAAYEGVSAEGAGPTAPIGDAGTHPFSALPLRHAGRADGLPGPPHIDGKPTFSTAHRRSILRLVFRRPGER